MQIYRLFPEEQVQAVLTAITSTAVFMREAGLL